MSTWALDIITLYIVTCSLSYFALNLSYAYRGMELPHSETAMGELLLHGFLFFSVPVYVTFEIIHCTLRSLIECLVVFKRPFQRHGGLEEIVFGVFYLYATYVFWFKVHSVAGGIITLLTSLYLWQAAHAMQVLKKSKSDKGSASEPAHQDPNASAS